KANADFRLVGPPDSFYRVYEYANAISSWRWDGTGEVNPTRWEPELREFRLNAGIAGRFVLVEQLYPGWRASLDGQPVPVELSDGVFQAIPVPVGAHTVKFEYSPSSVRVGAAISATALVALAIWLRRSRRQPH